MRAPVLRSMLAASLAFGAADSARAGQFWIVDASGGAGAHFTEITVALTVAQSGDVLYVRPGSYLGFTLDRGLAIIAETTFTTPGACRVENVPAGEAAVLAGMSAPSLEVRSCQGTVILTRAQSIPGVKVLDCDDVRISACVFNAQWGAAEGLFCQASRVELVGTLVYGAHSAVPSALNSAFNGANGITCHASRIHAVTAQTVGGDGSTQCYAGGYGGHGLAVLSGSVAMLSGTFCIGGNGGYAYCSANHCHISDGEGGHGLYCQSSSTWHSWSGFAGGWGTKNPTCTPTAQSGIGGAGVSAASPPYPILELVGDPRPGSLIQLRLLGEAGSLVRIKLGTAPVVIPTPGIEVEVLVAARRSIDLGVIPASQLVTMPIPISSSARPGLAFLAQAELHSPSSGVARRSNSVPVVVH